MSIRLVIILLFIAFTFSACENNLEELKNVNDEITPTIETSKGVSILYSEKGKLQAKLKAPTLLRHKTDDPYIEFPDGVTMEFFDDNQRATSTLKADYGIKYEKKEEITVKRNVEVVNEKGETLTTEELAYNEQKRIISSDKKVKIVTKNDIITGDGMEAREEEKFSKWRVINPVGQSRYSEGDLNQ